MTKPPVLIRLLGQTMPVGSAVVRQQRGGGVILSGGFYIYTPWGLDKSLMVKTTTRMWCDIRSTHIRLQFDRCTTVRRPTLRL